MIDILKTIANEIIQIVEENDPGIKLSIYMDNDFFIRVSSSINNNGFLNTLDFDFNDFSTIMGYQVYRVIHHHTRQKEIRHSNYEILIIED